MLIINDTESLLSKISSEITDSNLGYFSKPFRCKHQGRELIIKKYLPVKDLALINAIITNHNEYIRELKATGIKVPDTLIEVQKDKTGYQIIIIQEAFRKDELFRDKVEKAGDTEIISLCSLILDETIRFISNRKDPAGIGFHPTLRNYALHEGELWYFDTFPPMLMRQNELNKVIIRMSPFGRIIKPLIPLKFINLVSNEYYNFEKMFTGIVGSLCRLRPELSSSVLSFSKEYITNSRCSFQEKNNILKKLESPPHLPGIWTFFRRLSGNEGRPNI